MALAIRGGWLYSRALIALSLRAGGSDSPRFALAPEDIQYTVMHDIFSFANAIPFRDLLYPGNTLENKIKGKISDAPLPDFIHTYCDEIQQFSEYANTFMLQKQDMKFTDIDFGDIM